MSNRDFTTALLASVIIIWSLIFMAKADAATIHVESEKVVYFFGAFEDGEDVTELKKALEGKENVTVRFNSGGGSVAIGVAIAEVIAASGASTEVYKDSYCASICAYAWLAGKHRTVHAEGILAVHNVYQDFSRIATMSPVEYQHQSLKTIGLLMYKAEQGGWGAPTIYWAHLLVTPFNKMYAFTPEQIKELER